MFNILIERQLPRPVGHADPIAGLWRFWDHKRGDAPAIRRVDFDPLAFPELLGRVNLVEIETGSSTQFRFRLYGSRMDDPVETDMTRRRVSEIGEPAYADLVQRHYLQAYRLWTPVFTEVKAVTDQDVQLHYCRLILPMTSDVGASKMLLVASVRYADDSAETNSDSVIDSCHRKAFRYDVDDPDEAHIWHTSRAVA